MTTPSLHNLSQGDLAYSRLIQAIQAGEFRPGDRLRETNVADRLMLSRTPVREALRKLEAEGIVEHRPRIGAVIRTLGRTEIVELYEMRIVFERTAAEMAAKHANSAEVDEMAALNLQIEDALEDSARAASINQEFHRSVYMATRNRFLREAARALNNALMLLGPTTLADEERIKTVVAQHSQIIDAIRIGDADGAGAAAENHLQSSMRHRLHVLRL